MLNQPFLIFSLFCFQIIISVSVSGAITNHHEGVSCSSVGPTWVRKDQRESIVSTEYGEISAVEISDGTARGGGGGGGRHHLQFITLEPNALFLPVLLHADMVFYVHTGSGRMSWVDEDGMIRVDLQRGDVYRLKTGSVFFVQSNLEPERQKLRIHAIFANSIEDSHERSVGAYSSIHDLVLGFDKKVLQAAFNVPEEVIEEITSGATPEAIVHAPATKGRVLWEFEAQFMKALLGSKGYSMFDDNKKKSKTFKTFNILNADPDFENCNGRSLTVTKKNLPALKGSNIGLLMVNLTKGSMMGPHWNPMASEISIVIQGRGMVRVVCPSLMTESQCKSMSFRVEEGDVFVVPRFHPMAQMAFNNDSLVFVGFSTTTKKNQPQFLVGRASVLQTLDRDVVAASFNVTNTTISQLLAAQGESIILECTSCAEEEERTMEEEIEEEKEEARRREEEEARKREEERRREEEEARKREEEEARREEEEKRRKEEEEEARKREEEEARRREEEEEEEEEARRREEEERRREEEEAGRMEEEEERRREEEEEEEEEEEARRREEAAGRKRKEEEAKRREEEEEARREEEKREQVEEKRRREAAEREEEEAERQEQEREEMERREEQARKEQERQKEEEEARRPEEEEEEQPEEEKEEKGGGGESQPTRVFKKIWKV